MERWLQKACGPCGTLQCRISMQRALDSVTEINQPRPGLFCASVLVSPLCGVPAVEAICSRIGRTRFYLRQVFSEDAA